MKLFIATPTHSGDVCASFAISLVNTIKALTLAGIEVRWEALKHSAFIHAARNRLAQDFMASGYTDLLFADADMGWDVEGMLRMLLADVDVVGAICPKKKDPIEWVVKLLQEEPVDGLYECAYVGTALLRIRRNAFERMPQPWFDVQTEGDRIIGEDALFCRKWRDFGKVWAAPYIHVTHTGQKEWQGRYGD